MAVVIKIAQGLLISHHKIVVHNVQGHHSEPRRRSSEGRRNGGRLQSARGRRTGPEHLTAKSPDLATVAGRVEKNLCNTCGKYGHWQDKCPKASPTNRVLIGCPKGPKAPIFNYCVCATQNEPEALPDRSQSEDKDGQIAAC